MAISLANYGYALIGVVLIIGVTTFIMFKCGWMVH